MKIGMILFALGVCYVSLPVTWQVAAVGQSTVAEPAPAVAESTKPQPTDDEQKNQKDKP